jgi:molybdopterin-guanine dinucleotide biosynthesis protein B
MSPAPVPLIGFAAFSGVGKTTLLTRLISLFKEKNIRVGVIKHSHHPFNIDHPGKDSFELRKSGARQVLIGSGSHWALIVDSDHDLTLNDYLRNLQQGTLDLILVEGFKREPIPKIELHRPSLGHPLLADTDPTIIAVATDDKSSFNTDKPLLDLNQPVEIAEFIINRVVTNDRRMPRTGAIK